MKHRAASWWVPAGSFALSVALAVLAGPASLTLGARPKRDVSARACIITIKPVDCPEEFSGDEAIKISFHVTVETLGGTCLPAEVETMATVTVKDGKPCRVTSGLTQQPSDPGKTSFFTQTQREEDYRVVLAKTGKCLGATGPEDYDLSNIESIRIDIVVTAADSTNKPHRCDLKKKASSERKKCKVEIKPVNCPELTALADEHFSMSFRVTISGPKDDCLPGTVTAQAVVTLGDGKTCTVTKGVAMQPTDPGESAKFTQQDMTEVFRVELTSGSCKSEGVEQVYDLKDVAEITINLAAFGKDGSKDSHVCTAKRKKK